MSKFTPGDIVLCKGTSGYGDYSWRNARVVARKSFFGIPVYLVLYKVNWIDAGYTESFRRWRFGWQLTKEEYYG